MATICPYQNRKCNTCSHYRPDPDSSHGELACWVAQDLQVVPKRPKAILKYMDPDDQLSTEELNRMVEQLGSEHLDLVNADTEHGVLMGVIDHETCDHVLNFNTTSNGPYIRHVGDYIDRNVTDTSTPVTVEIMGIRTKIIF